MASSSKKITKDLDCLLRLNDALFANFTPMKMLQGNNISQLSAFITDILCKPQMYKKRLMVNTLNCLLDSWEEDVAVYESLIECVIFLSAENDGLELLPAHCYDDCDSFCLFAKALLNLCKDGQLKAEISCKIVKMIQKLEDSENKLLMIRQLWSEKGTLRLPIETLEELVLMQPILVEEPLVDMALAVARATVEDCYNIMEEVLAEPAIVFLLDMCAHSPPVFQIVTSMMHSLVCRAPLNVNLLRLLQEVVVAVSRSCRPCGIVPLLPLRPRMLALHLQLDPELLPDGLVDQQQLYMVTTCAAAQTLCKGHVLQMIATGLVDDPAGTSALLVFYPKWMKQLSRRVVVT